MASDANGQGGGGGSAIQGMTVSASSPLPRPTSALNDEQVGDYLDVNGTGRRQPRELQMSPSASNLAAHLVGADEDRGALSEVSSEWPFFLPQQVLIVTGSQTELSSPKARRRLFGRSQDSGGSGKDKELISPTSARSNDSNDIDQESTSTRRAHTKGRRSIDNGRVSSDRLSIFGGFSSGTFGKSRKPPPRYSS